MFPEPHTYQRVMIGEAEPCGRFKILQDSGTAMPAGFPWNQFLCLETKGYT